MICFITVSNKFIKLFTRTNLVVWKYILLSVPHFQEQEKQTLCKDYLMTKNTKSVCKIKQIVLTDKKTLVNNVQNDCVTGNLRNGSLCHDTKWLFNSTRAHICKLKPGHGMFERSPIRYMTHIYFSLTVFNLWHEWWMIAFFSFLKGLLNSIPCSVA